MGCQSEKRSQTERGFHTWQIWPSPSPWRTAWLWDSLPSLFLFVFFMSPAYAHHMGTGASQTIHMICPTSHTEHILSILTDHDDGLCRYSSLKAFSPTTWNHVLPPSCALYGPHVMAPPSHLRSLPRLVSCDFKPSNQPDETSPNSSPATVYSCLVLLERILFREPSLTWRALLPIHILALIVLMLLTALLCAKLVSAYAALQGILFPHLSRHGCLLSSRFLNLSCYHLPVSSSNWNPVLWQSTS